MKRFLLECCFGCTWQPNRRVFYCIPSSPNPLLLSKHETKRRSTRLTYKSILTTNAISSRFFWSFLFITVMLSSTSESAYSIDEGYGSLLPPAIVQLIGYVRWLAWIVFVLDGLATTFSFKKITRYHGRFLIFYGILFVAALTLVGNLADPVTRKEFFRYTSLLVIFMVLPLQIEGFIHRKGLDATLKLLFYNVLLLTFIGIAATLRATGFTFRYTGWVDNPNQFVLIYIFFVAIATANLLRRTLPLYLLVPTFLFLVYTQLASGSRNGLVGLLVLAGVFLMTYAKVGVAQKIAISLLLGLGIWLFLKYGPESSFRIFDLEEATAEADTGRLILWEQLWPYIRKKWMFGWGVAGREIIGLSGNSHNTYLTLMIFFGIPLGILMGVWFVWACLANLFILRGRENQFTILAYLFSSYMATVFVTMTFEDSIFGIGSPWSLQLVLAIGIVNTLTRSGAVFMAQQDQNFGSPMVVPPPADPNAPWSPEDFH